LHRVTPGGNTGGATPLYRALHVVPPEALHGVARGVARSHLTAIR
jgi:hypothetical protein